MTTTAGSTSLCAANIYLHRVRQVRPTAGPAQPRAGSIITSGNGTFVDVAAAAGVTNEQCAKGAAWGDYDGDGRLDLFVSNIERAVRVCITTWAMASSATSRPSSMSPGADVSFACWFWDYDNDGRLDLLRQREPDHTGRDGGLCDGHRGEQAGRPRLYRNLGEDGFRDVTREVGLDRPIAPMGCNFGDIDNDGYLDLYLGTGWMSYSSLVPNRMFKNVDGTPLRGRDDVFRHGPSPEGTRRFIC